MAKITTLLIGVDHQIKKKYLKISFVIILRWILIIMIIMYDTESKIWFIIYISGFRAGGNHQRAGLNTGGL